MRQHTMSKPEVHLGRSNLDPSIASIAGHAVADWAPEAEGHVSSLAPGLSKAALLLVDISGEAAGELTGVHILKVAQGDGRPRDSRSGEERALAVDEGFAKKHVPGVLRYWSGSTADGATGSAMLLEIAGGSLRRYTAPTRRGSVPLQKCAERIVGEMVGAWTELSNVTTGSVREFIYDALGTAEAEEALELADEFYGVTGSKSEYGQGGIHLTQVACLDGPSRRWQRLPGLLRGDAGLVQRR